MQIEAEEKPTPEQAWETTKSRLTEKRPDKVGWLRLGTLKKFHEGLFMVQFPASAMDDARKQAHIDANAIQDAINDASEKAAQDAARNRQAIKWKSKQKNSQPQSQLGKKPKQG